MQSRLIALIVVAGSALSTPAAAQRIDQFGAQYPAPPVNVPQPRVALPTPPAINVPQSPIAAPVAARQAAASRWGGRIDGRWEGGARAPGGWAAYRRPVRGWRVPNYWLSPNFAIADYAYFGFATPPSGYRWTRYYDDALLIDERGRVYDSVSNVRWDDGDAGGYATADQPTAPGYGTSYQVPGYRWEGEYRGAWVPTNQPAPGYAPPARTTYAPPPAVGYARAAPPVQPLPPAGYSQTWSAGGYASGVTINGQFYPAGPPGTVQTVTVASAPVVTTTTTEYVTETRRIYVARRVYRKKWHPKPRVYRCGCVR